jgi:hypothetical protein
MAFKVATRFKMVQVVLNWYNLIAASAAGGGRLCDQNGLWPSVPTLVGNATLANMSTCNTSPPPPHPQKAIEKSHA